MTAELQQRATQAQALRAAHVERARYHADLARRRYLAVDPANRLVAESLEADWNTALRAVNDAQHAYEQAQAHQLGQLTANQKARIQQLVTDLPSIWHDPATPAREGKRITRLLLTDVTVTKTPEAITAHMRLRGGQHHSLTLPAPLPAPEQRRTPTPVITAINELLNQHTSGEIATILNQRGLASGTDQPFHRLIIDNIIRTYRIPTRRQRLRATGMLTATELATIHQVHPQTIKHWRHAGIISGQRYNDKGEYLYHPPDPNTPLARPKTGRPPKQP